MKTVALVVVEIVIPILHKGAVDEIGAEGQINKLKMVKRQMYGPAKVHLLEARLIGTT